MIRKIIIVVAPVSDKPIKQVKNPLSPVEVANEVISCAKAGASMVHLHVRDIYGKPTLDLKEFSETLDLIRCKSDIIIQGSTGGLSNFSRQERCVALNNPKVEVASLNMGSANFDDGVYINTLPDIRYWASYMKEKKVKPELEVFEGGMINNAIIMMEEGYLDNPLIFSFCFGFRGALPANIDALYFLKNMIPSNSIWGVVHHGMVNFSFLVTALGMGATLVRVGFEDSIYYMPGKVAKNNVELVEKFAKLVTDLGYEIATPEEARTILSVRKP